MSFLGRIFGMQSRATQFGMALADFVFAQAESPDPFQGRVTSPQELTRSIALHISIVTELFERSPQSAARHKAFDTFFDAVVSRAQSHRGVVIHPQLVEQMTPIAEALIESTSPEAQFAAARAAWKVILLGESPRESSVLIPVVFHFGGLTLASNKFIRSIT
jgi:hypothetical protein